MIATAALTCLALTIYHEARSEPILGQYAVALVVMNRAKRQRQQVCHEAFKPKQFSWTNDGVTRVEQGWRLDEQHLPREERAWWLARRIAAATLAGRMVDFTRGSTHYHTHAVAPEWRKSLKLMRVLGQHRFYAAAKQSAVTVALQ